MGNIITNVSLSETNKHETIAVVKPNGMQLFIIEEIDTYSKRSIKRIALLTSKGELLYFTDSGYYGYDSYESVKNKYNFVRYLREDEFLTIKGGPLS